MTTLDQLVDFLIPPLFKLGAGPFWLSVTGSWEDVDLAHWAALRPDEDDVLFQFFRGPFGPWQPGPGCRALVLVVGCTSALEVVLQGPEHRAQPSRRYARRTKGVLYLAVAATGEQYAVVVGPDGPWASGQATDGYLLNLARSKLGLPPGPADPDQDLISVEPWHLGP